MNESSNRTLQYLKVNDEVFIGTFNIEKPTHIIGSKFIVIENANGYAKLKKKSDEGQIITLAWNIETGNGSQTLLDHWYLTPKPDDQKTYYTGIFTSKEMIVTELQKVIAGNNHASEVQKKIEESEKK